MPTTPKIAVQTDTGDHSVTTTAFSTTFEENNAFGFTSATWTTP
jgi:hypothetical protein